MIGGAQRHRRTGELDEGPVMGTERAELKGGHAALSGLHKGIMQSSPVLFVEKIRREQEASMLNSLHAFIFHFF